MQNTARIQAHPNTLIKNFFIAGVSNNKLKVNTFYLDDEGKPRLKPEMEEPISAEVLFSMYQSNEDAEKYL